MYTDINATICVYLCASVFELQNKNIPSRTRLNPERLTMPQDVAIGFHQQVEFRGTAVLHGGWSDFADEAHERQARGGERMTVALNLERCLVWVAAVSARIVGAAHHQRLASLVLKGDFESAERSTTSIWVTLDDFRPNAVAELGKNFQNALFRGTVTPYAKIHPIPGVWEHKTS